MKKMKTRVKGEIQDKWFYFPTIIFSMLFLKELIQYSWITRYIPIHVSADLNTYILNLYFLVNYGFHKFVPFVYGDGFISFTGYPIGWAFFTLPFYYLTKQYLLSAYITLIITFVMLLIAFYLIGRINNFSLIKTFAFYILFLANPLMLDSIFHIGRSSEIFSWMIFSIFFLIILWYKDNPKNYKFLLLTITYSLVLLSHIYQFIVSTIIMLSLFLIVNNKEKVKIIISIILTLIITSFWWMPFSVASKTYPTFWSSSVELRHLSSFISYNTITILLFLIIFYLYYKSDNTKREIMFYIPSLVLTLLILTRVIIFIPVLKEVPVNIYTSYLIFLGLFMFLKIKGYSCNIRKLIIVLLILLPIISVIFFTAYYEDFSLNYKKSYKYTQTDKDVIALYDYIDGRVFVVTPYENLKRSATYSEYATILKNKRTTTIVTPIDASNRKVVEKTYQLFRDVTNKDCSNLSKHSTELLTTEFLSYEKHCDFLEECKFKLKKQIGNACLYENNLSRRGGKK